MTNFVNRQCEEGLNHEEKLTYIASEMQNIYSNTQTHIHSNHVKNSDEDSLQPEESENSLTRGINSHANEGERESESNITRGEHQDCATADHDQKQVIHRYSKIH